MQTVANQTKKQSHAMNKNAVSAFTSIALRWDPPNVRVASGQKASSKILILKCLHRTANFCTAFLNIISKQNPF